MVGTELTDGAAMMAGAVREAVLRFTAAELARSQERFLRGADPQEGRHETMVVLERYMSRVETPWMC